MKDITYLGEHTFTGQLGNFFIVLAFVTSIASFFAFWKSHKNELEKTSWKKIGQIFFRLHSIGVLGIIVSLFYIIHNHYYEYLYVWTHSNNIMPARYIFSCFWEGQEGSTLLWVFWHMIIGNILLKTSKKWEAPVLSVFSITQIFLTSMLLGIYLGEWRIGSNPFLLMREAPQNIGLPWTSIPDYLSLPFFEDGRGLNPLLQNYWMVIHPPIVFLGFALFLVPFSYSIAGLWKKDFYSWVKPALPWTYLAIAILGLGILMGGAWGYESLNFNGFWAWDPVENASLVPWMILVGAGHLMLVNLKNKKSIFTTFFLVHIAFILVFYSTYLTKSGVLGESSVHAFTDNGMNGQLVLCLIFFIWFSVKSLLINKNRAFTYTVITGIVMIIGWIADIFPAMILALLIVSIAYSIISYNKNFAAPKNEDEKILSREFWMFVGALILLLSALHIIFNTSIPVYNIFGKEFSEVLNTLNKSFQSESISNLANGTLSGIAQKKAIPTYHKWQIPFAFIITLLIACGQFFKYKNTKRSYFLKTISIPLIASLILTIVIGALLNFSISEELDWTCLLFSTIFTIVANTNYWLALLKGKFNYAGASIAHIGFGLVLLGALISTGKSKNISENNSIFRLSNKDQNESKNGLNDNTDALLWQNDTIEMDPYFICYKRKYQDGINLHHEVEYFEKETGKQYYEGDIVIGAGMMLKANKKHIATSLPADMANWTIVPKSSISNKINVTRWTNLKPGKKLFTLNPFIQLNEKFGNVSEPSTKHYWNRDIYTHVKYSELEEPKVDFTGYLEPTTYEIKQGDSIYLRSAMVVIDSIVQVENKEEFRLAKNDIAIAAYLTATDANKRYHTIPLLIVRDSSLFIPDIAEIKELGLKFSFKQDFGKTHPVLNIAEHKDNKNDFIVMQAIIFPYINILWIGCIVMVLGTLLAVIHRIRTTSQNSSKKPSY